LKEKIDYCCPKFCGAGAGATKIIMVKAPFDNHFPLPSPSLHFSQKNINFKTFLTLKRKRPTVLINILRPRMRIV
jgi:hypothetical protein